MLGRMRERRLTQQLTLLEPLLPVCMFCKSVRSGDEDRWEPLERYVARRSGIELTHGICPSCVDTHYPQSPDSR